MRAEIRFAGFGGQGIISAGKITGRAAAIFDGKNAVMMQSYGPEARGGACNADLVVSDATIGYPQLHRPRRDVVHDRLRLHPLSQRDLVGVDLDSNQHPVLFRHGDVLDLADGDAHVEHVTPDVKALDTFGELDPIIDEIAGSVPTNDGHPDRKEPDAHYNEHTHFRLLRPCSH